MSLERPAAVGVGPNLDGDAAARTLAGICRSERDEPCLTVLTGFAHQVEPHESTPVAVVKLRLFLYVVDVSERSRVTLRHLSP